MGDSFGYVNDLFLDPEIQSLLILHYGYCILNKKGVWGKSTGTQKDSEDHYKPQGFKYQLGLSVGP